MDFSEEDKRILAAFALAKDEDAELEPILSFYEILYRTQFEAKRGMEQVVEVAPRTAYDQRLAEGEKLLVFEQLHLEPARFIKLVRKMSYVLLENSPGWELPTQPIDTTILTDIAHRWFESGEPVVGNGPPTTLVALAVGFALSAYLQKAAEVLGSEVDLGEWKRNTCPICGGKPGFATLTREDGSRILFCPRCHTQWLYKRTTCPFCENEEGIVYYSSEDQVYRLYVCPSCNRYIKTMDLRQTDRTPVIPVERVVTLGIDLVAQEKGYLYC